MSEPKEIVAGKIGDYITNDSRKLALAVEVNQPVEWLERRHMQLMADMDLGIKWQKLAESKTLFRLTDSGEPIAP